MLVLINVRKGLWRFCVFMLLTIPFISVAQTKCYTIVDSATSLVVPYCNISLNKGYGFTSNNNGAFCVPFSSADSLVRLSISNIAYFDKQVYLTVHNTDSIIQIRSKEYSLNEVAINWSNYRFTWCGNTLKQPDAYINLWRFCQTGLYIPALKHGQGIIENVEVPIKNTSLNKVPFRLHIFSVDSIGGVGKELLPENVFGVLHDTIQDRVLLDVLKYQINIPAKGVYVTLELLSNNKPDELQMTGLPYFEENNNQIGISHARFRDRKLRKVSSWKPNSYFIEEYPFTMVAGMVGDIPLIKVKVRSLKQ